MTVEEAKKLVDPMLMTNPHAAGPVVDAFKKEKKLINGPSSTYHSITTNMEKK